MPVESVYERVEPLLPLVRPPFPSFLRALNSAGKGLDPAPGRWALMYPDACEIRLAHQGVPMLSTVNWGIPCSRMRFSRSGQTL